MDFWGAATSILCAIHCAVLPLLLSVGMVSSHALFSNPIFEIIMIAFAFVFVYNSIIKGYMRNQVSLTALLMAISGLLLIAVHHLFSDKAVFIVVFGGILVAVSHLFNMLSSQHKHNSQI